MTQEDEQIAQRRANLAALADRGVETYPRRFDRTHTITALVDRFGETPADALEAQKLETTTAGRIIAIRSFGKASFLVISDGRSRIQAYIRKDALPEQDFETFRLLDYGDYVDTYYRSGKHRSGKAGAKVGP